MTCTDDIFGRGNATAAGWVTEADWTVDGRRFFRLRARRPPAKPEPA